MTDNKPAEQKSTEHPLKDFKSTSETAWDRTPKTLLEVSSINPPPPGCRDSCGSLLTKCKTADEAAAHYRDVKKLPSDWPVKVVFWTDGIPVRSVVTPKLEAGK